ncbi:MAG: hypothetical protein EOP82_22950 [Variovorax sp.]|nr:MAG: hypothetical protein EOP82_22950 [Variovorax sp.]
MRKIVLPIGAALIQMVAIAAFAQTSGEADPSQAKAAPTAKTTSAERASARTARQAQGSQAARGPQMGEVQKDPVAKPVVTKEERQAGAEKRRAANRSANKSGEFARGGNADAPEKQKP